MEKIDELDTLKIDQRENNIDASGKYLIPGLFDAHAHANSYEEDFQHFIHFGVTSIFMPGGSKASNAYYKAMRTLSDQDSLPAPQGVPYQPAFYHGRSASGKNLPWRTLD